MVKEATGIRNHWKQRWSRDLWIYVYSEFKTCSSLAPNLQLLDLQSLSLSSTSGQTAVCPGVGIAKKQRLDMWPLAWCINISQSQYHGFIPPVSTLKSLVSYELQEVSGKCDSSIKYVVDLKEKLNVGTKCSKQEYEKTDVNDSDLCSLPSWSERECKHNKISEEKNSYLSKVVALHIIPRTFLPLKTFFLYQCLW